MEIELNLQHTEDFQNPDLPGPNFPKAKDYTMQALKLFRPDFDLDKIDTYFLTFREFELINTLAVIYGDSGDLKKELEILQKLKTNFESRHKIIFEQSNNLYINGFYRKLIVNIGIVYSMLGLWEECLQNATANMELFIKYNDINTYARSLYQRAYSLMMLGKTDEGKVHYQKFLMLAYVLDGNFSLNFDFVKKQYEEVFGQKFEISSPFE